MRADRPSPGRVLVAALLAGGLSGVPSTVHALSTKRSPLAAVRAAGELLGRPGLARGLAAHALVTMWWTAVLAALVPRSAGAVAAALRGAVGGAGIAALDLTIARRRFPAIAALPTGGQVADHVVFGAVVGTVLQWVPTEPALRSTRPSVERCRSNLRAVMLRLKGAAHGFERPLEPPSCDARCAALLACSAGAAR